MKQIFLLLIIFCQLFSAQELLKPETAAPSFVLTTPSGSREYLRVWNGLKLMKPYKNKIRHRIILSFWSTTCLPCMTEIPELHKFAKAHPDDSLKIFLINLDKSTPTEIKTFADDKGWTLPILLDPYQNTAKRYGVSAIPTLYVISPMGEVEHAFTGIPEGYTTDAYLEEMLFSPKIDSTTDSSLIVIDTSKSSTLTGSQNPSTVEPNEKALDTLKSNAVESNNQ